MCNTVKKIPQQAQSTNCSKVRAVGKFTYIICKINITSLRILYAGPARAIATVRQSRLATIIFKNLARIQLNVKKEQ